VETHRRRSSTATRSPRFASVGTLSAC
jgi:hypothetical protein